jgi:hypothetical protein
MDPTIDFSPIIRIGLVFGCGWSVNESRLVGGTDTANGITRMFGVSRISTEDSCCWFSMTDVDAMVEL